jgi:beta-galactosidase
MVRRDRNHPSVVMWSIGNEIDYPNDPFSHPVLGDRYRPQNPPAEGLTRLGRPLVEAVKKLDATRPVTAALAHAPMSDAVGFADVLDVAGYNYQETRYAADHRTYPRRILIGSENNHRYDNWAVVRDNGYVAGQFLWTGIDYLGESRGWPSRGSGAGLLDTCGFKKPMAWFRQSLWSDQPVVYLCTSAANAGGGGGRGGGAGRRAEESWNRAAGSAALVTCYTNCPEVQLTLNGKPVGTKKSSDGADGELTWTVPYEPGTLKAVGLKDGRAACEFVLKTAGAASRIELVPDATQLLAGGKDVCHLEFRVTDAAGVRVPDARNVLTFKVTGPAKLLGIDNGEMTGPVNYAAPEHATWRGRGLAILRSTPSAGAIAVEVTSPGLEPARLELSSR